MMTLVRIALPVLIVNRYSSSVRLNKVLLRRPETGRNRVLANPEVELLSVIGVTLHLPLLESNQVQSEAVHLHSLQDFSARCH